MHDDCRFLNHSIKLLKYILYMFLFLKIVNVPFPPAIALIRHHVKRNMSDFHLFFPKNGKL